MGRDNIKCVSNMDPPDAMSLLKPGKHHHARGLWSRINPFQVRRGKDPPPYEESYGISKVQLYSIIFPLSLLLNYFTTENLFENVFYSVVNTFICDCYHSAQVDRLRSNKTF